MAASSNIWFPTYFHFRFGGQSLLNVVFRQNFTANGRAQLTFGRTIIGYSNTYLLTYPMKLWEEIQSEVVDENNLSGG